MRSRRSKGVGEGGYIRALSMVELVQGLVRALGREHLFTGGPAGLRVARSSMFAVYEVLVNGEVIVRDYDLLDWVLRLAKLPVIEEGEPGSEAVLEAHRLGIPVTVRVLEHGLSEAKARELAEFRREKVIVPSWVTGPVDQRAQLGALA